MARVDWNESDVERWLIDNPRLPDGEPLLILQRQTALRRVVDLVALDQRGGLVILEIKNERSTRTVIGQAIEYLSQYERLSEETLARMFAAFAPSRPLHVAYAEHFVETPLRLSPRRRVYIVAPSFDVPSAVCARFLTRALAPSDIELHLVQVRREGESFTFQPFEVPDFVSSRVLAGRFGRTIRGRLFYGILGGPGPILWNVGRIRNNGTLRRPTTTAARGKLLQRREEYLIPCSGAPWVDTSESDTVWEHQQQPAKLARLIGILTPDPRARPNDRLVTTARFQAGVFTGFRTRNWLEFQNEWRESSQPCPTWEACFALGAQ